MKRTTLLLLVFLAACGGVEEPKDQEVMQAEEPEDVVDDADDMVDDGEDRETVEDRRNDPTDPEDPAVDPPVGAVSLADLYEPLFVASGCTAGYCHGTFGSAEAVLALVGEDAAAPVCGRTKFIVPGEPEQSILWLRTRDTTDEDIECEVVKMPRGREENLDPEITQMLHDWIADGANP